MKLLSFGLVFLMCAVCLAHAWGYRKNLIDEGVIQKRLDVLAEKVMAYFEGKPMVVVVLLKGDGTETVTIRLLISGAERWFVRLNVHQVAP